MLIKASKWVAVVACLSAFGCASKNDPAEPPPLTVEQILATTLDESEYGESHRCLAQHEYDRVEVLDNRHLLFSGRRGKAYLNTLRTKCIGLRRNDPLRFDVTLSQLCSMDTVSSIASRGGGISRVSAVCSLGEFQEIPEEQADLLREQIRSQK